MSDPAAEHRPAGSLDVLLAERLSRDLAGTALAGRTAAVRLASTQGEFWTVTLTAGRPRARRGHRDRADVVVRGSSEVLCRVVAGELSAVEAFLSDRVTLRGDLALALQLDALFPGPRPDTFPRAGRVRALGVDTCYLAAGPAAGPAVVLLHGLGATNASMLPLLAALAPDHRVLSPDLPGFGGSGAPRATYNSPWFAAWLQAFQVATGSRPAVLVGNSLGGRVALEAGLARPGSVRALVLLTPSPAFRRLRQLVPLVRALHPTLGRLPALPVPHPLVVESIRAMMSVPDRMAPAWYDAAADEFVRVYRSPAHRFAFLAASRQIYLEQAHGRAGFWNRLPGLSPPALFLWGDRDRLVPASFARHVGDVLPHAASIVLEDCGHVPQFEHPAETEGLIRGFLDTVPDR